MRLKIIHLLVLALAPLFLYSQDNARNLSIDLSGGANYSYGDINSLWAPTGNFGVKYTLSNQFGLRGSFRTGLLKGGEDEWNREFENQYFQYSMQGVFNISQMTNLHQTLPKINLLANVGIGRIHNDATDTRRDYPEGEESRPDNTGTALVYPFGGTVKFYLSKRFDVNLRVNYVYASSDKIDNYAVKNGSNRFNDGYATFGAGLTYKFGSSDEQHQDWERKNYQQQMKELKKDQRQKMKALKSKVDKLQTLISSNSLASWENEARLNRLQNQSAQAQGKDIMKPSNEKEGKEVTKKDVTQKQVDKKVVKAGGLSNKRFVTVLGSFKSESSAKELAKEIKEKGYDPGVLYNYYKGWYYVHVNKNEELDAARKNLKETREDVGIEDAWIYFRSADDLEKYNR